MKNKSLELKVEGNPGWDKIKLVQAVRLQRNKHQKKRFVIIAQLFFHI